MMTILDLAISAPVIGFLVWLYWYSAPPARHRGVIVLDRCLLVLAPALAVSIIVACHRLLDIEGMGLSVIAVAAAYLAACAVLGLGWLIRHRRTRRPNDQQTKRPNDQLTN